MTDNTALLKDTRLEQMAAPEKQLDFLLIGSRLIRKATEATSPDEPAAANTSRKELRSIKMRLAADITTEIQEDNIEGQSAGERIARELAQQFGNDLADLMLNGDTAVTGADASFLTRINHQAGQDQRRYSQVQADRHGLQRRNFSGNVCANAEQVQELPAEHAHILFKQCSG